MGIILHPSNLTVPGSLVLSFGSFGDSRHPERSEGAKLGPFAYQAFRPFGLTAPSLCSGQALRVTRGSLGSLFLVYDLVVGIDHVALGGLRLRLTAGVGRSSPSGLAGAGGLIERGPGG